MHLPKLEEIPRIPLAVLGLGVYRAWIEIAFVGSFVDYPTQQVAGHNAFDIFMIAAMFVCAALAKRLSPLWRHAAMKRAGLAALLLATLGGYLSVWLPEAATWLAWPCALLGGAGIAVLILLWSEFYGCLAPVRICLYYAASLVCGAVIIYIYKGFMLPWLPVMTCLLPIVSLLMLRSCYRTLPENRQPVETPASFTFPVKPVAVVAVYSFAFGLQESGAYQNWGPHSSPGMLLCAVLVVLAICLLSRRVEFETIYGTWLPLLSAAFLVLPTFDLFNADVTGFCANFGYAASEIFVMTMMGSLSYHYGVSAIWLFGIERGVRAVAMMGGRVLDSALAAAGVSAAPIVVLAVLVATFMVATERRVSSPWGVQLREGETQEARDAALRSALVERCGQLGREHGLSQREEEVLLLLAQGKTAGEIAHELLVANGTVKAHVGHIYQKLDIHCREELLERVSGRASGSASIP
jgi:DNA-binding CsgD family transcriptional regulator